MSHAVYSLYQGPGEVGLYHSEQDAEEDLQEASFPVFLSRHPTHAALLCSELTYSMLSYHRWRAEQLALPLQNAEVNAAQAVDPATQQLVDDLTAFGDRLATMQRLVSSPAQDSLRLAQRLRWREARKTLLGSRYVDERDEPFGPAKFTARDTEPRPSTETDSTAGGKRLRSRTVSYEEVHTAKRCRLSAPQQDEQRGTWTSCARHCDL